MRTSVLSRPDCSGERFAKAITGAWYETMQKMTSGGPAQVEALKGSAAASSDTIESYREQLKTTALFSTPKTAVEFTTGVSLKQKMDLVRQFCITHGLLGKGTRSVDDVFITSLGVSSPVSEPFARESASRPCISWSAWDFTPRIPASIPISSPAACSKGLRSPRLS